MEISIYYDECTRKEERKTPCFCSPSVMPSILRQLDDKENMFPGSMNVIPSPHAVALSEEKTRPALQDVSCFFASACSLEDAEQPEEEEEDNSNSNNNTNNIAQNTSSTSKPGNAITNKKVTVTKKKTHSSSSSIGVSNTAAALLLRGSNNNIAPERVNQLKNLR
jgi:hypothetical protein